MNVLASAATMVLFSSLLFHCKLKAAEVTTNLPTGKTPVTAKEFFNAGTINLSATNLSGAESMFQAALAKQDEAILPLALYNLGHVRFAQGSAELKKNPSGSRAKIQADQATRSATSAIQSAEAALASNDVQQMVEAYVRGRGARKQLRTAYDAVQRALETYGGTLQKWRRSLADFQSATELNPANTNAAYNASVVERNIAVLVDSLIQIQIPANGAGDMEKKLKELMSQLKGKIPDGMLPGGPGDDGDEDMNGRPVEDFMGMKTGGSKSGEEMEISLSPEEAGNLLDGYRLGGERPLSSIAEVPGEKGDPKDRKLRDW